MKGERLYIVAMQAVVELLMRAMRSSKVCRVRKPEILQPSEGAIQCFYWGEKKLICLASSAEQGNKIISTASSLLYER